MIVDSLPRNCLISLTSGLIRKASPRTTYKQRVEKKNTLTPSKHTYDGAEYCLCS